MQDTLPLTPTTMTAMAMMVQRSSSTPNFNDRTTTRQRVASVNGNNNRRHISSSNGFPGIRVTLGATTNHRRRRLKNYRARLSQQQLRWVPPMMTPRSRYLLLGCSPLLLLAGT